MTLDAFSDLVLFIVCARLAWATLPARAEQAGIGLACLLIGIAALLGVFRFSSWSAASQTLRGAHAFASLVAAIAAFPLWAFSLSHGDSALARRLAGAFWFSFALAGLGVAIVLLGFKLWQQVVPAMCGLWIAHTVLRKRKCWERWRGSAGLACLFGSFAAALLMTPEMRLAGFLSKTQLLHYGLAAALWLICGSRRSRPPS